MIFIVLQIFITILYYYSNCIMFLKYKKDRKGTKNNEHIYYPR